MSPKVRERPEARDKGCQRQNMQPGTGRGGEIDALPRVKDASSARDGRYARDGKGAATGGSGHERGMDRRSLPLHASPD